MVTRYAKSGTRPWSCQARPARKIARLGQNGGMDVQGFADGRFGPVRECFAEIVAAQPGTGAAFAAVVRRPPGG